MRGIQFLINLPVIFIFLDFDNNLQNFKELNKFNLPTNFKDFKVLINKKNINRISCINLPFDAVLKALR